MSGVYQAGRIKRARRTKAQVDQLEAQIVDVLEADHPQSVRHVFYRMTDPRLPVSVEKTESGYEQVQNRLVKMRRDGKVPYGWITDATRRGYFVNTFGDAGDFIQRMSGLYRSELWERTNYYVEVWCESRSIAGVMRELLRASIKALLPHRALEVAKEAEQSERAVLAGLVNLARNGAP